MSSRAGHNAFVQNYFSNKQNYFSEQSRVWHYGHEFYLTKYSYLLDLHTTATQDIFKYQFALQWSIVCLIVIWNFYFSELTILHDKQRLQQQQDEKNGKFQSKK